MITPVAMPQMGLEVAEGVVVAIHVAVGARVVEGDPLVELETDKALSDVGAPRDGFVHSVEVQVGDTVAIGDTLVVLAADLGSGIDTGSDEPAPAGSDRVSAADGAADSASGAVAARAPGEGRLRAAPVARRAAERLGVPLDDLVGTGPSGRITLADVERHAAALPAAGPPPAPASATGAEQLAPLNGTRRAVARRMTQSQQIPQFALNREIDASWLLAEKEQRAHDLGAGVSINDLIVQALAETVLRHPDLARSYVEPADDGGAPQLRLREGVDVALAVATERGLLVPVIRRAHERPLHELASERARLVAAARSGRLALEEMSGSTITLSSLAGFGVDSFVAMLNPGESAILAVGRAVEKVLPRGRGLAIAPTLSLTLTIDHRVIDGASGGAALAELAALLEGAMTWRT
jgi:pyruvate dehydrogenase E2 component (dihydrolipoamide acetyltransferase)